MSTQSVILSSGHENALRLTNPLLAVALLEQAYESSSEIDGLFTRLDTVKEILLASNEPKHDNARQFFLEVGELATFDSSISLLQQRSNWHDLLQDVVNAPVASPLHRFSASATARVSPPLRSSLLSLIAL